MTCWIDLTRPNRLAQAGLTDTKIVMCENFGEESQTGRRLIILFERVVNEYNALDPEDGDFELYERQKNRLEKILHPEVIRALALFFVQYERCADSHTFARYLIDLYYERLATTKCEEAQYANTTEESPIASVESPAAIAKVVCAENALAENGLTDSPATEVPAEGRKSLTERS